jgi:hypothetical protein
MTDKQTPPDWVLLEAAKRAWGKTTDPVSSLRYIYDDVDTTFRALCDMIERYEQPPVDRKVLCAREALSEANKAHADVAWSDEDVAVRAIELWEEGFGE